MPKEATVQRQSVLLESLADGFHLEPVGFSRGRDRAAVHEGLPENGVAETSPEEGYPPSVRHVLSVISWALQKILRHIGSITKGDDVSLGDVTDYAVQCLAV